MLLVNFTKVSKDFGGNSVFREIDLEIMEGERIGLVGENGGGKSTLLKLLASLDEPTSGVSTRDKAQIMDTVSSVVRAGAVTAVVIEHDMTFVRQIARKVTVLDEGRILCEGTVQEVQRDPKVIEVYLGQDQAAHAADRTSECVVR